MQDVQQSSIHTYSGSMLLRKLKELHLLVIHWLVPVLVILWVQRIRIVSTAAWVALDCHRWEEAAEAAELAM